MKNELRVFFIRKPDYACFGYVTVPLHSLVTSNLRHLDVVSAKTGLSPCGLDPVFVLKPRPQDVVQLNQPKVDLMKYLFS